MPAALASQFRPQNGYDPGSQKINTSMLGSSTESTTLLSAGMVQVAGKRWLDIRKKRANSRIDRVFLVGPKKQKFLRLKVCRQLRRVRMDWCKVKQSVQTSIQDISENLIKEISQT